MNAWFPLTAISGTRPIGVEIGCSHAGVLLAVPALIASGIFDCAQKIYGRLGPAFFGLRTTLLTLLLMALWRIKRPEGSKEHPSAEWGRVLGVDRPPEVKTLRRKLARLAACNTPPNSVKPWPSNA